MRLIEKLREFGFSVSVDEELLILRVLQNAGSLDELRISIRGIVVKSAAEQKVFDKIFPILLGTVPSTQYQDNDLHEANDRETVPAPGMTGDGILAGAGIGGMDQKLAGVQSGYKMAVRKLILEGAEESAEHILLRYILPESNSLEDIVERQELVMDQIEELIRIVAENFADILIESLNQALAEAMQDAIRTREELDIGRNPFVVKGMENQPMIEIRESPELQHRFQLFAKKIAMRNRRKRNLAKKGVNFSRTIRVNMQNGGRLLKIIPTRKYSKKPRLVVITDVSPSTIHATRLFLSILSAIKDVFEDIQFYEFIGSCIDVTTEYKRANSVPEAIDAVVDAWNKVRWGKESSDYQQAFADFLKVSQGKISKRHKIVILADCRDWLGGWKNGKPICVKHLQTMRELVGGIWVFNPEEKKFWDRGDSIVFHMQETGVQVIEAVTLNQLARNIETYLL